MLPNLILSLGLQIYVISQPEYQIIKKVVKWFFKCDIFMVDVLTLIFPLLVVASR